jgi:hypothetical protein
MVVIVVGIISIIVVPKINIDSGKIPPVADVVASDIRYTQMLAMSTTSSACITLGATAGTTYTYGASYNSTSGLCNGTLASGAVGTAGATRDLTAIASGVTASSTQPSFMAFNSLGEPYGIAAPATVTITGAGNTKTLTVQPYTGKVQ